MANNNIVNYNRVNIRDRGVTWSLDAGGPIGIGAPVIGGVPTEVLYIDNNGNLYSDSLFTRDSVTNDTFMSKTNLITNQDFDIAVANLGPFDAAAMLFNNLTSQGTAAVGVTDAGGFGGTPGFGAFIVDATDGFNQGTQIIGDSVTVYMVANDGSTNENAAFTAGLGFGTSMTYSDGVGPTYFWSALPTGLTWGEGGGGNTFIMPTATAPTAGQCLGSVAGGTGQLSWITPAGGGGITIGAPVVGGTPKEVLYIDLSGNLFSDAAFYRDSATTDFAMLGTGVQTGFTSGIIADGTQSPNVVILHADLVNTIGSTVRLGDQNSFVITRNNTTQLATGLTNSLSSTPKASTVGYTDGINAITSEVTVSSSYVRERYISASGTNTTQINPTTYEITSNIPNNGFVALRFDYTNQSFAYGDVANMTSGWGAGLTTDPALKTFIAGDIASIANGMVVYANDITEQSGFGDIPGVKSGTSFFIDGINNFGAGFGRHYYISSPETFNGTGLDDGAYTGTWTGLTTATYTVTIDHVNVQSSSFTTQSGTVSPGDTLIGNNTGNTGTVLTITGIEVTQENLTGSLGGDTLLTVVGGPNNGNTLTGGMVHTPLRDTFVWDDGGPPTANVPITVGTVSLSDGIGIGFGATIGHTVNDSWTISYSNQQSTGLALDYVNGIYGIGDMQTAWFQTQLFVDDPNRTVIANGFDGSNTAAMLRVNADPDLNQLKTQLGWGSLVNESTGLRNVSVGPGSGTSVTDGDDNAFYGFAAGGGAAASGVSRNAGFGKEALYSLSANQTDNTGLGYKTDVAGSASGSIAIGSEAVATGYNQCVIGSSTARIESFHFGGGVTDTNADQYNLVFKGTSAAGGVDKGCPMVQWESGNTTGSRGGVITFSVAKNGSSGSSVNIAAANEKVRINPDEFIIDGGLVMATNNSAGSPAFAYGTTFATPRDIWHFYSDGTGTGTTTINLSGTMGEVFVFSDVGGNCSTHNIVIDAGASNTIYGQTTPGQTYTMNTDNESVTMHLIGNGGSDWAIVARN